MNTASGPEDQAEGTYGYCSWHKAYTRGVRLVRLVDFGSGFGSRGQYACGSCRVLHDLVPLSDRPL